jgi:hypothetical protein
MRTRSMLSDILLYIATVAARLREMMMIKTRI